MKINLKELHEGSNPVSFEIPAELFDTHVHEADDLYHGDGAACAVELVVDRYEDILTIRGTMRGPMRFECARCLAERKRGLDMRVRWTLVPASQITSGSVSAEEEQELTSDDLDVSFYTGDEVDLGELARETLLLELEPCPRCDVDECEGDRYLSPPPEADEVVAEDARWAQLGTLRAEMAKRQGSN